jgi:hypothetical protein
MITTLKWFDRHLWSVPILMFLVAELALSVWSAASRSPVLLAAAKVASRQQIYSSLTGSSSALLGLALAAVAILAAFGPPAPRGDQQALNEARLARARANLIGSLLVASFFLLVILVTATTALAVDSSLIGKWAVTTTIEASAIASVLGLLISGLGLALVIADRVR